MILAYARVSTAEQAADGKTSLQEQERQTRAFAQMKGIDQFDVVPYVDDGVSGAIPLAERPAGAQMLLEAREGDTVCASKLDRIFRSASDALVTIESLTARKIDLVLLDIGITPVGSNGVGKMFFSMLAAFAEFERGRITERMSDGRKGKRRYNGHVGGSAPYGYKVVGRGKDAKLEPVPEEQECLKMALSLWRSGVSKTQVVKEIHAKGFRARNGTEFTITQIDRAVKRELARAG